MDRLEDMTDGQGWMQGQGMHVQSTGDSAERAYGSLGALAPDWYDGERSIDTDEIYERFFGWVEDVKGIQPWPHQEEAIMDLLAGDHVILNTPTGSGKSLVALAMHFAALCTGRRSYYTAPIKALVSEKFFDLVDVFGREIGRASCRERV